MRQKPTASNDLTASHATILWRGIVLRGVIARYLESPLQGNVGRWTTSEDYQRLRSTAPPRRGSHAPTDSQSDLQTALNLLLPQPPLSFTSARLCRAIVTATQAGTD